MPFPADEVPVVKLDGRTLVYDRVRDHQVLWIEGVVALPIGSVIQLGNPNVDAIVVGVRFWASSTATVILDCDVPDGYWTEETKEKREPLLKLV